MIEGEISFILSRVFAGLQICVLAREYYCQPCNLCASPFPLLLWGGIAPNILGSIASFACLETTHSAAWYNMQPSTRHAPEFNIAPLTPLLIMTKFS